MKRSALLLSVSLLVACGSDDTAPAAQSPATIDDATVEHVPGTYEVPVDASLRGAASYATSDIRWSLVNGEARLSYDLPPAIVGKKLSVDFRGPFDTASGKGTLTGEAGTAECTMTGDATAKVDCRETMHGLLPIAVDQEAVSASATADGASIADRIKVADQFAKDPIGIIHFTVSPP